MSFFFFFRKTTVQRIGSPPTREWFYLLHICLYGIFISIVWASPSWCKYPSDLSAVEDAPVALGAQKPSRSHAPAPGRTVWCWAGMARAAPGWVCRLVSVSRTTPCPLADPSSGCISQRHSKLHPIDCFYSNSTTKPRAKKPVPATDVLLDLQQVTLPHGISAPSLTRCGCARRPRT